MVSASGENFEVRVDLDLRHRTEDDLAFALRGLKDPCGLARNTEIGENRTVGVADVGERQAVTVNKTFDLVLGAVPADADDRDLARPFLACRLDRGGFTVAGDSIRRPEPEGDG